METWIVVLVLAVVNLIIGGMFAGPRYSRKLNELEKKLLKERVGENLEFRFWKVFLWIVLALIVWWLVFPYEWVTKWRQWTYPYCLPGGAPKGWDKMLLHSSGTVKIKPEPLNLPGYPKILPHADTIAALKVSGKAAAKEVNERMKKLEDAEKISPELMKKEITI
ncbi:MAG: hypothetical protein V1656_00440 [Candidatus Jorgensenbacteria bacterium]